MSCGCCLVLNPVFGRQYKSRVADSVGRKQMASRREFDRAARSKYKRRMSFWEQKAESEKAVQARQEIPKEGDGEDAAKEKRSGVSIYSFDARKNPAEIQAARTADLKAALVFCEYQFATSDDLRIIACSIHRAEYCLEACKRTKKKGVRFLPESHKGLMEASESIRNYKITLQRLKDGDQQQAGRDHAGKGSQTSGFPPRPSTPPFTAEVSASWIPPRPRTPPRQLSSRGHAPLRDFPPYTKPPDAAQERSRNAQIYNLKNLGVPPAIRAQLQDDVMEKIALRRRRPESSEDLCQDYRIVDALPRDDIEYTM